MNREALKPRPNAPLKAREKIGILGFLVGVVAGAMLFRSHGWLAEAAAAGGAGAVGFIVAPTIVVGVLLFLAFAKVLGRIYWEVLTGRRKLPRTRDGTTAHRKRMLKLLGAIFIVAGAIWVGLYFRAPEFQRPRVLRLAGVCFGACLVLVMTLLAVWWRIPARKDASRPREEPMPGKELQEFSANFDSEMVRPFLERIRPFIDSGFGSDEVDRVCQVVATLQQDQERTIAFQIRHAGKEAELEVHVFMDDVDAPDIYFFAQGALRGQIESEFGRFAEERGI
jgi:hypothetical protein